MTETIETLTAYPTVLQVVGLFGFMLYVRAFTATQSGRLCGNGIIFSINQVVAASCVLISLLGAYNLSSFLNQISYIRIGIYGIVKRRRVASLNPPKPWLFKRASRSGLTSPIYN